MVPSRTATNTALAMLQVVVSGCVLFLLYRYLLIALGPSQMGAWSLVLATTSASRLAELGLTGSVVRFVALHLASESPGQAREIVETAAVSLALAMGFAVLVAQVPLAVLLPLVVADMVPAALAILPYALATLWVGTLSGVFQSALDGCQRTDIKVWINILGSLLWLILSLVLVPRAGLLGLAYAQFAQAVVVMGLSWFLLRRQLPGLPWMPYRWRHATFREILHYGVSFQAISMVTLLYDPITKILLGRFGDLSLVAYYEMANRLVMQLRGLLTAPGQVMVALVARATDADHNGLRRIYRNAFGAQVFLAVPLYTGILAALPWVGEVWIGGWQASFVGFGVLLTLGWFLNGFVNPAYFANLGFGELRSNLLAHVAIAVGNVAFGVFGGYALGGIGVVGGWVIALIAGSAVLPLGFHQRHRMNWGEVWPVGQAGLFLGGTVGVALAWSFYVVVSEPWRPIGLVASLLGFLVPVGLAVWFNPMRHRLLKLVTSQSTEGTVRP